jgi:hypothetical protein
MGTTTETGGPWTEQRFNAEADRFCEPYADRLKDLAVQRHTVAIEVDRVEDRIRDCKAAMNVDIDKISIHRRGKAEHEAKRAAREVGDLEKLAGRVRKHLAEIDAEIETTRKAARAEWRRRYEKLLKRRG